MTTPRPVPTVSFQTARRSSSTNANELGMRLMQERAYNKRREQKYLLIKLSDDLEDNHWRTGMRNGNARIN